MIILMTVPGSSLACGGERLRDWLVLWRWWNQLCPAGRQEDHLASVAVRPGTWQEAAGSLSLLSPLSSLLPWASPSPPPPPASSLLLHQSRSDWEYLVNQDPRCHRIVIARGLSRNSCFYISHRLSEGRKESYTQKNSLNPSRRE